MTPIGSTLLHYISNHEPLTRRVPLPDTDVSGPRRLLTRNVQYTVAVPEIA
jgi:hypothetical protein